MQLLRWCYICTAAPAYAKQPGILHNIIGKSYASSKGSFSVHFGGENDTSEEGFIVGCANWSPICQGISGDLLIGAVRVGGAVSLGNQTLCRVTHRRGVRWTNGGNWWRIPRCGRDFRTRVCQADSYHRCSWNSHHRWEMRESWRSRRVHSKQPDAWVSNLLWKAENGAVEKGESFTRGWWHFCPPEAEKHIAKSPTSHRTGKRWKYFNILLFLGLKNYIFFSKTT